MEIIDQIKAVQDALGIAVDGVAGSKTWSAIYAEIVGQPTDAGKTTKPPTGPVVLDSTVLDERTRKNIATLLPEVQPHAVQFMQKLKEEGYDFRITSGTRTYEEQDELYRQGRSNPGKIVTNARGGFSNHNFGIAFDITLFRDNEPIWESPLYARAGFIGKQFGFSWGGDWKGLKDEPHYEFSPPQWALLTESELLSHLRASKNAGQNPFTV